MQAIRLPEAIETERLVLRPWTDADGPALYEAVDASRERLGAWLPWVAYYTDPSATASFFAQAREGWRTGANLPLAVTERGSGRILGGTGFHGVFPVSAMQWEHRIVETGYWLREGEEGKGYMREAVRAEIRLAFEHLGMEKLAIRADARNLPSRRVAESLGFRLDAVLRNELRTADGGLRDSCSYSLLREEATPLIASWADEPFHITWSDQPVQPSADDPPASDHEPMEELPRPALLETPRLILRRPTLADAEPLLALLDRSRASFERWLVSARRIRTLDDARNGIAQAIADAEARRAFALLAFERAGGELIGGGQLHSIDPRVPGAEVDWWLDDRQTGKGYATEIGAAQLRFVMEVWQGDRADAWCDAGNQASRRVAERIGFVAEGVIRQAYSEAANGLTDWAVYSVIPSDYERIAPSLPDVRFETD